MVSTVRDAMAADRIRRRQALQGEIDIAERSRVSKGGEYCMTLIGVGRGVD